MHAARNGKYHKVLTQIVFLWPVITPFSDSIEDELLRLQKNRERRYQREKAKGGIPAADGSPGSPGAGSPAPGVGGGKAGKPASTPRKCANCGQVGHIKTNKKYGDKFLCELCARVFEQDTTFA